MAEHFDVGERFFALGQSITRPIFGLDMGEGLIGLDCGSGRILIEEDVFDNGIAVFDDPVVVIVDEKGVLLEQSEFTHITSKR